MRFLLTFCCWLLAAASCLLIYDSLVPPVSTLMAGRLLTGRSVARRFVPLDRMSGWLPRAAIAAEDGKFCEHHGVDWESLHRAVDTTLTRDPDKAHGASTISMQVAKNLFLWPGRSYLRKGVEIPLAMALDTLWGKRLMMEQYLNVAEFGDGIYGADAAARHYFGTGAANLSAHQAALLIAVLPNPRDRSASHPGAYVQSYAASIAARAARVDSSCIARHSATRGIGH